MLRLFLYGAKKDRMCVTVIPILKSEINQTGLKIISLDSGFVCDVREQQRLYYIQFGTKYILVSTLCTYYILAVMYGT